MPFNLQHGERFSVIYGINVNETMRRSLDLRNFAARLRDNVRRLTGSKCEVAQAERNPLADIREISLLAYSRYGVNISVLINAGNDTPIREVDLAVIETLKGCGWGGISVNRVVGALSGDTAISNGTLGAGEATLGAYTAGIFGSLNPDITSVSRIADRVPVGQSAVIPPTSSAMSRIVPGQVVSSTDPARVGTSDAPLIPMPNIGALTASVPTSWLIVGGATVGLIGAVAVAYVIRSVK